MEVELVQNLVGSNSKVFCCVEMKVTQYERNLVHSTLHLMAHLTETELASSLV